MGRLTFGDLRRVVRFFTEGHLPVPGVPGTIAEHLGPTMQAILIPVESHPAWARVPVWARDNFGRHADQESLTDLAYRIAADTGRAHYNVPEMSLDDVAAYLSAKEDVTAETCDKPQAPVPDDWRPPVILTGWQEIAQALDMNTKDGRDKLKSLNKRFDGPVKVEGQGCGPVVCRDDLIRRFDQLAASFHEQANQQEGA
jgi:hypothetical protein